MSDILAPTLGESVSEATVARWTKKPGDAVKKDEVLVELETDKVSLEVAAPADGVLGEIAAEEGATVTAGQKLGAVEENGAAKPAPAKGAAKPATGANANAKPVTPTMAAPSAEEQPEPTPGKPAEQALAPVTDTSAPGQTGGKPAPTKDGSGAGVEVTVPTMGESVTEGTVGTWTRKVGDKIARDEVLVEIETDKVAVEIASPADGVLSEITAEAGSTVTPNQVIARIGGASNIGAQQSSGAGDDTPANEPPAAQKGPQPANLSPSVQRIVSENRLDPGAIQGTGPDGRITKGDALEAAHAPQVRAPEPAPAPQPVVVAALRTTGEREERVRMTRLRQTIARRLKDAQNAAAMLTTFNEVDMTNVMALRNQYKDSFEKKHGVKLGFMSFFTRACIAALKEVPDVNAEIDGQDVIYKNHYDIGVAVGTDKGLVVPVVRDADELSLAGIEKAIGALGKKARDGKLAIEDMQGGTFTITNGGVYGSLMSTPILNAPQSGVLGMHNIVQRPMAVNGQVLIRPMMYLALSYDHRIVDGKGAVTFLVAVKNAIEDPQRMLLDV
ncbi:2-oxoglutarate dehydrogenase complex dihydrolipoyllysine-residue succinyltransferase [Caulobacter sp. S45]|uniref:2-oxoglutarate dehydrogenase complex dihydrolipoyllysine-residue succinyltransferase n=1 Tax=Caulobacter sp. S45 TaxID=1641861 RepID=UPI0015759C6B